MDRRHRLHRWNPHPRHPNHLHRQLHRNHRSQAQPSSPSTPAAITPSPSTRTATHGHGDTTATASSATAGTPHDTTPRSVAMPNGVSFTTIDRWWNHSLALDQNGDAWAWGSDYYGSWDGGTNTDKRHPGPSRHAPRHVIFTTIDAGFDHSLAIDQNGDAWAWGRDDLGPARRRWKQHEQEHPFPPVAMPNGTHIHQDRRRQRAFASPSIRTATHGHGVSTSSSRSATAAIPA